MLLLLQFDLFCFVLFVLQQQAYGKEADWWTFGVLLFEMITGLPPFYNENLLITYERILNSPVPLPKWLSLSMSEIILALLTRDPKKRLGSSSQDAQEIKQREFFQDIDFEKLFCKEIKPPFKPKVPGEEDTTNVEDEFTDETPKDCSIIKTGSCTQMRMHACS